MPASSLQWVSAVSWERTSSARDLYGLYWYWSSFTSHGSQSRFKNDQVDVGCFCVSVHHAGTASAVVSLETCFKSVYFLTCAWLNLYDSTSPFWLLPVAPLPPVSQSAAPSCRRCLQCPAAGRVARCMHGSAPRPEPETEAIHTSQTLVCREPKHLEFTQNSFIHEKHQQMMPRMMSYCHLQKYTFNQKQPIKARKRACFLMPNW